MSPSQFCPPPVNSGAPASVARPGSPGRLGGTPIEGCPLRGKLKRGMGDWVVICEEHGGWARGFALPWHFDAAFDRSR